MGTQCAKTCAIIGGMMFGRKLRKFDKHFKDLVEHGHSETQTLLRNVGWVSAGVATLAVGVVVGRELRARYKFNRRTPYDVYSHAGSDGMQEMEFGVGT